MKVLFDQGTPVPLRSALVGHEVATAYESGWSALKNGELLSAAESAGFEVLVTTDQNLRYQQNLPGRRLALVVLMTTDWRRIRQHTDKVVGVFGNLNSGDYVEVAFPTR